MADTGAFETLLTYLETSAVIDIDRFYALMRRHYGFSDLMYLETERRAGQFYAHQMECTHARNRAGPCFGVDGRVEDQAIEMALKSFRPLDYDFVRRHAGSNAYLTVAVAADNRPLQGIALPLKCPPGRAAALIVEASMQPAEWRDFLHQHLRDLQFIASLFHSAASTAARMRRRETTISNSALGNAPRWTAQRRHRRKRDRRRFRHGRTHGPLLPRQRPAQAGRRPRGRGPRAGRHGRLTSPARPCERPRHVNAKQQPTLPALRLTL